MNEYDSSRLILHKHPNGVVLYIDENVGNHSMNAWCCTIYIEESGYVLATMDGVEPYIEESNQILRPQFELLGDHQCFSRKPGKPS